MRRPAGIYSGNPTCVDSPVSPPQTPTWAPGSPPESTAERLRAGGSTQAPSPDYTAEDRSRI